MLIVNFQHIRLQQIKNPNQFTLNLMCETVSRVKSVTLKSLQSGIFLNRVQQQIGLPNYTRIKAQTIQKELFKHNLVYKDVGKRKDYPAVADLDYSEQTFARMKKGLSNSTQYGLTCGGSRLTTDGK